MGTPRAQNPSPVRVATPLAFDTFVQPEIAATTPAAPKEMPAATQDVGASSSGPSSWEDHVSHLHPFDVSWVFASVAYLHLEYGKVAVYSANPWIESFAHTV